MVLYHILAPSAFFKDIHEGDGAIDLFTTMCVYIIHIIHIIYVLVYKRMHPFAICS